jgi:hypothetical protein
MVTESSWTGPSDLGAARRRARHAKEVRPSGQMRNRTCSQVSRPNPIRRNSRRVVLADAVGDPREGAVNDCLRLSDFDDTGSCRIDAEWGARLIGTCTIRQVVGEIEDACDACLNRTANRRVSLQAAPNALNIMASENTSTCAHTASQQMQERPNRRLAIRPFRKRWDRSHLAPVRD